MYGGGHSTLENERGLSSFRKKFAQIRLSQLFPGRKNHTKANRIKLAFMICPISGAFGFAGRFQKRFDFHSCYGL
jgi:hypothetical protein